jgi:hypothetical protein
MTISSEIRPRAYASMELIVDLLFIVQTRTGLDLESLLIRYCVAEATMRPLIAAAKDEPELMTMALPPEDKRGAISRLVIADRTGLPRETVRRKTNNLIKNGWLVEDEEGRIRTVRNLADPATQKALQDIFSAVQRYDSRLRSLGCAGITPGD